MHVAHAPFCGARECCLHDVALHTSQVCVPCGTSVCIEVAYRCSMLHASSVRDAAFEGDMHGCRAMVRAYER